MRSEADRCPNCDKPPANGAALDALPKACRNGNCGGCDACRALCWREWHGGICQAEPVDWRARAIAAEAALAECTRELHTLCDAVEAREAAQPAVSDDLVMVALVAAEHDEDGRERARNLGTTHPDVLASAQRVTAAVARAVLDAIRAVPVDDLLDAADAVSSGASRANDVDANVIRARLIAAAEAAEGGEEDRRMKAKPIQRVFDEILEIR